MISLNGKEALVTGKPIFNQAGELVMAVTNVRGISDLNSVGRVVQQKHNVAVFQLGRDNVIIHSKAVQMHMALRCFSRQTKIDAFFALV